MCVTDCLVETIFMCHYPHIHTGGYFQFLSYVLGNVFAPHIIDAP